MPVPEPTTKAQLQFACKISAARWVAWLSYSAPDNLERPAGAGWAVAASYGLTQKRQRTLNDLISIPSQASWLSGALASGRTRWQESNAQYDLNCKRIYLFPNHPARKILAVGVDELDENTENICKLLSYAPPGRAVGSAPLAEEKIVITAPPDQALESVVEEICSLTRILDELFLGQPVELIFQQIARTALEISGAQRVHLVIDPANKDDYTQAMVSSIYAASGAPEVLVEKRLIGEAADFFTFQSSFQKTKQSLPIPCQAAAPELVLGSLDFYHPVNPRPLTSLQNECLAILAGIAALAVHNTLLEWKLAQARQDQLSTHSRLLQSVHLAALGEIASQIANNLNNPLTSIILALDVLKQQMPEYTNALPEKLALQLQNHLNLLMEQSLRTRKIVWEILNTARNTRPLNKSESELVAADEKGT